MDTLLLIDALGAFGVIALRIVAHRCNMPLDAADRRLWLAFVFFLVGGVEEVLVPAITVGGTAVSTNPRESIAISTSVLVGLAIGLIALQAAAWWNLWQASCVLVGKPARTLRRQLQRSHRETDVRPPREPGAAETD